MTLALTRELAARLEGGMAAANPRIMAALQEVAPDHPGAVLTRSGMTAVYGGDGFPLNEAVGVGMMGPVAPDLLDAIEAFYAGHHHASAIRVSSLAHPTAVSLTAARGYHLVEFSHRWVLDLKTWRPAREALDPRVRAAEPPEELEWARTMEAGFADTDSAPAGEALALSRAFFRMGGGAVPVIAREAGVAAACGMLDVDGEVAALFSGSTRPAYRRRGLQSALLDTRLRMAQARGCTIATIETDPGSGSQRNVERLGFQLAYAAASLRRP